MQEAQSQDELFDVVDKNDIVIDQKTRSEVHAENLLHRAVHIFVFNEEGDMLLQRRSMQKDSSPGKWTTACSGHVDAGEDYDTSAVREIEEELGIHIDSPEHLERLLKHPPCEETGWEFVVVYQLGYNGEIKFNKSEIMEICWASPDDLALWLGNKPEDFANSFKLLLPLLEEAQESK